MALNIEAKEAYARGLKAKKAQAWQKAEVLFLSASKLEPTWTKPLEAVIRLRLDGHLNSAPLKVELRRFAALLPKSYKIWLFKGRAAHQSGQYSEALQAYTKVLEIRPRTLSAMLHRADIYLHLGKPSQALADYEQVLSLRKSHIEARWGKLLALVQLEEWLKAHEIGNELAAQDPDNIALWNLRNLASRFSGLPPPPPKTQSKRDFRKLPPSDDVDSPQ